MEAQYLLRMDSVFHHLPRAMLRRELWVNVMGSLCLGIGRLDHRRWAREAEGRDGNQKGPPSLLAVPKPEALTQSRAPRCCRGTTGALVD